ncbi:MAG: hypothetical protein J6H31_03205 [Butyrivibrio sp.]|nr:hypothetical protein [Butyrivibrio sp.]
MIKKNNLQEIPHELYDLLRANVHGSGHNNTVSILKYLMNHMSECDSYIFDTIQYDVIHWIDEAMMKCLFPLELKAEEWIAESNYIHKILKRSEELLEKVAPKDFKEGYITHIKQHYTKNIIEYAQRLNVYFCALYMFTGDYDNLQKWLDQLLVYTENNISHLISDETESRLIHGEDWSKIQFEGTYKWEPLNIFCCHPLPDNKSRELVSYVYENYVLFLYKLSKGRGNYSQICKCLYEKAEKCLYDLCYQILEEINRCIQENGEYTDEMLINEKEEFETMLCRIDERGFIKINTNKLR